jgi:uncharacterized membrane protein YhhN
MQQAMPQQRPSSLPQQQVVRPGVAVFATVIATVISAADARTRALGGPTTLTTAMLAASNTMVARRQVARHAFRLGRIANPGKTAIFVYLL